MGSKFKVGDKVVCIDSRRRWYKLGGLKQYEIYTVVGFNPYDGGLILQEVKSLSSGYHAYAKDRFRKIDYEFAEEVIAKITPARKSETTKGLKIS
ncbi:hypothetical protein MWU59_00750 [Flavobacteriaceae bacterium F08102]|nr:hypothetical protein [Flavobacteriaceae bacterium F08102]